MHTIYFGGSVIPDGAKLNISKQKVHCRPELRGDPDFELSIEIVESNIYIECRMEEYNDVYYNTVYIQAFNLAGSLVDLASFATGSGWRINIDRFTNNDGVTTPIRIHDPFLERISTAFSIENVTSIPPILLTDARFMVVLNDLIHTNVYPRFVAVSSARTVEGIRHLIDPSGREKSWKTMRETLNLTREYIDYILQRATTQRHGNWDYIPLDTNKEIVCRAWTIMDRYIVFRLRGEQRLDKSMFPDL